MFRQAKTPDIEAHSSELGRTSRFHTDHLSKTFQIASGPRVVQGSEQIRAYNQKQDEPLKRNKLNTDCFAFNFKLKL